MAIRGRAFATFGAFGGFVALGGIECSSARPGVRRQTAPRPGSGRAFYDDPSDILLNRGTPLVWLVSLVDGVVACQGGTHDRATLAAASPPRSAPRPGWGVGAADHLSRGGSRKDRGAAPRPPPERGVLRRAERRPRGRAAAARRLR